MAEFIVGQKWKSFIFRFLTSSDEQEMSQHFLDNFYPDEPLSIILGASDLHNQEFDEGMFELIPQNLSFAAIDKDTGKLAGFCVIGRKTKDKPEDKPREPWIPKSEEMKIICKLLNPVDAVCDIFELYNVDEFANICLLTTAREFRRQGLATELMQRALVFLKASGFSAARVCFTNPYSWKVGRKCGYQELGRRYYRELEDMEGRLICPMAGDDEFAAVCGIRL